MKVIDHLKRASRTLFSVEILPPLKGTSIQNIWNMLDPVMEFRPAFIDVTYHREEYVYKKHENGLLEKISMRKRPGTVGICSAIINKYNVDTVPHIICGGFSREETENALIDLNFLGIDNVLLIRGDAIKSENAFHPEPSGHHYAIDLVRQVVNMNNGRYLDEDLKDVTPSGFCIGVAGYPEKHFEAPNMRNDLKYLKMKIDAGADYIVTQMFFDNRKFFEFEKMLRDMDIHVPVIPGLKPITTKKQATTLPKIFHIDIPDDLLAEIEKCKNDEEVKQVGIEWCIQQSKELVAHNAQCLHYYTMGKAEVTCRIARGVF